MDGNNLNVLVEAKKEYMEQLCSLLCPLMIETFLETYREAIKMSKNKQVLIQYQKLLKEVPNWNNHIVKQHTTRLCDACSWFSDLLAAVFVSCVKILSSVRLNAENKKISVKLPSNEVFVHGCYVAAAKELYKDPYIYHDQNVSEYEREANLSKRFTLCIEETVKAMIPIQQILHTYISNGEQMAEKNLDFDNTEEVVDEPDLNEEDEEVEDEQPAEVEATPPPATDPAPTYVPEETKSIPVINPPPQAQGSDGEGDDDVLFPGAPETVTKNPQ